MAGLICLCTSGYGGSVLSDGLGTGANVLLALLAGSFSARVRKSQCLMVVGDPDYLSKVAARHRRPLRSVRCPSPISRRHIEGRRRGSSGSWVFV